MHGRHERAQPLTSRAPLFILLVVLVLALSNVLVSQTLGSRQGASGGSPPATPAAAVKMGPTTTLPTTSTPTTSTPTTSRVEQDRAAVAGAVESCRLTNLRYQAAIGNAAVSLAQFEKHIDAMNLLVAGKISIDVARTFWDQTRVAAAENAAAFRAADKAVRSTKAECLPLSAAVSAAAGSGEAKAVSACSAAVKLRGPVITYGRVAVSTWEHHVHEMEMLRKGEITPAQASAAWLKSWKTGDRQLKTYQAAAGRAAKASCPLI